MYNAGGVVMQSQTVEVTPDSANAANLELALIGAGELAGTIEAPAGSGPFKVVLQPLATRVFSKPGAEGDTNKEGAFRIGGILPGKYRVMVQPLPENAYIKTMQLDGAPSSDGEIDLSRGAARFTPEAGRQRQRRANLGSGSRSRWRTLEHDGGNPPA